jgi:hypothetical protein
MISALACIVSFTPCWTFFFSYFHVCTHIIYIPYIEHMMFLKLVYHEVFLASYFLVVYFHVSLYWLSVREVPLFSLNSLTCLFDCSYARMTPWFLNRLANYQTVPDIGHSRIYGILRLRSFWDCNNLQGFKHVLGFLFIPYKLFVNVEIRESAQIKIIVPLAVRYTWTCRFHFW